MASHMQKELKVLKALAEDQGWVVPTGGTGHYQWISPSGVRVCGNGSSPSDWRAVKNLRASLRRAGLRLPAKDGRMR